MNSTHTFGSAAYQHSTQEQVVKQLYQQMPTDGKGKELKHLSQGMKGNSALLMVLMSGATMLMVGQSMNSIEDQLKLAQNRQTQLNQKLENEAQTQLPDAINLSDSSMATVQAFQEETNLLQGAIEANATGVENLAKTTGELDSILKAAGGMGNFAKKMSEKLAGTFYQTAYRKRSS